MFPSCEKITVSDGYNFQMMPRTMDYENTILGVAEDALAYVNEQKEHSLKSIHLELNDEIENKYVNDFQEKLNGLGWKLIIKKQSNVGDDEDDEEDDAFFKLQIK